MTGATRFQAGADRGFFLFGGRGRLVLLLVWIISALYVFPYRNRGWIPHDEGVLGHSAEEVLKGHLPHRDFQEIYTGGLTYWNALSFRLFGLRLTSIRLLLFLSFLAFIPAVFAIATRFGPPLAAGAVTFLCAAWSLPNYFTAIPSWYNLFLGAWAVLALLRHIETGGKRWLFLAGLLAGFSCLFKVIGAHVVAAGLLLIVYRETAATPGPRPEGSRRITAYLLFLGAGLALFLAFLFQLIRSRLDQSEFAYFLLPSVAICGFLLWREYREGGGVFLRRVGAVARSCAVLVVGAALPIVLFLAPFALQGALQLFGGAISAGTAGHVRYVRMFLPPLRAFLPALPYAIVLAAGSLRRISFGRLLLLALAGILSYLLIASRTSPEVYLTAWNSARFLAPLAVFAACLRLRDAHRLVFWDSPTRQKIFLLTAIVAITGLVQWPFAAPIYFVYVAPFLALQVFTLAGSERKPPRAVHAAMLAFYLLFAILRTNTGYVYELGHRFERYDPDAVLDLPRVGGLRVPARDAALYGSLVPLVQGKSGGRPIFAGPDCPEIAYLTGLPEIAASPDPPEPLLKTLSEAGSRVVILNLKPAWLPKIRPATLARYEAEFPNSREFERFLVRWKD